MLNQIYIHYITTLFVLEYFIISCWLLKGKKIGIGIGQFARKKSVSESATKNHDRCITNFYFFMKMFWRSRYCLYCYRMCRNHLMIFYIELIQSFRLICWIPYVNVGGHMLMSSWMWRTMTNSEWEALYLTVIKCSGWTNEGGVSYEY